jgi:hypothetical protein
MQKLEKKRENRKKKRKRKQKIGKRPGGTKSAQLCIRPRPSNAFTPKGYATGLSTR